MQKFGAGRRQGLKHFCCSIGQLSENNTSVVRTTIERDIGTFQILSTISLGKWPNKSAWSGHHTTLGKAKGSCHTAKI